VLVIAPHAITNFSRLHIQHLCLRGESPRRYHCFRLQRYAPFFKRRITRGNRIIQIFGAEFSLDVIAMKLLPCALGPSLTVQEALTLSSNFSSAATLPEKISEIALGYSGPLSAYRTDFLFAYDIFPRFLMRAEVQWARDGRAMRVGDIIVQRAVLPPIGFGLCAEFAVRISALINEPSRLGFAYETLAGHLERGVSEFYFEERGGEVFFVIHTCSEPAHWLSRLGRPFSLAYQKWCTRQALKHVKQQFESCNPNI
jgi:Domain of unknown function (DUF1990)